MRGTVVVVVVEDVVVVVATAVDEVVVSAVPEVHEDRTSRSPAIRALCSRLRSLSVIAVRP
jgi:hypothetical protein